jgi:hypothetical protein
MSIVEYYFVALLILAIAASTYWYVSLKSEGNRLEQARTDDLRVEYLRHLSFYKKLFRMGGGSNEVAHKVALDMLLNENEDARKRWERVNGSPYPIR